MSIKDSRQEGRAVRLLEGICRAFAIFGAAIMVVLAIVTVVSVLGRWLINKPISGDFEIVQIGCAIAVAAFLPYCQLKQGNVIVDFFTMKAPQSIRNLMDSLGCLLLTFMAGMFAWRLFWGGYDLHRYNDQTMILQFPTWLGFTIIVPSMALLAIAGLLTAWRALNGRFYSDPVEKAMEEL